MSPLASAEGFLPFLYPSSYKVFTNIVDGSAVVSLPTSLQFGRLKYNTTYVSNNYYNCMNVTLTVTDQYSWFNQFWYSI